MGSNAATKPKESGRTFNVIYLFDNSGETAFDIDEECPKSVSFGQTSSSCEDRVWFKVTNR
ncbi:hypothetical protein O9992_19045 [Vibrio lentus]|nr:hypothetical protein [Vibrio lentus]